MPLPLLTFLKPALRVLCSVLLPRLEVPQVPPPSISVSQQKTSQLYSQSWSPNSPLLPPLSYPPTPFTPSQNTQARARTAQPSSPSPPSPHFCTFVCLPQREKRNSRFIQIKVDLVEFKLSLYVQYAFISYKKKCFNDESITSRIFTPPPPLHGSPTLPPSPPFLPLSFLLSLSL